MESSVNKFKTVVLIFLLSGLNFSYSQTTDLFISEYVEGSSNNKYIEIFNGTGASVNLADYRLRLFSNGAAIGSPTNDVLLSGTLANNSVIVYKNASAAVYGGAATTNAAVNFNGNDALGLFKISTGTYVDIFANIGCDPGTSWTNTNTTIDKTLVRNASICGGITSDDATSCPFPTLASDWTQSNVDVVSNLGSHTCNCVTANTITLGALTGAPFDVTCSAGDNGAISFTSTGTFNAGNVYTAQLSNSAGTFTSPVAIGTLTSTANSGTINITIPLGTVSASAYKVRIVSSNTVATSNSSANFTVTLTGTCVRPYITGVMINSCNPTCTEGNNELIFGSTGDYSVQLNASNVILKYDTYTPSTSTYTDAFTAMPGTTTAINSAAGCTILQDGLNMTIPPNSKFVIARSTLCVDALVWSSLCSNAPVYILYTTDATWNTSGNFVNSASGLRYFRSDFASTDGITTTIDYSYNSDLLTSHADGDFVTFNYTGGAASSYLNNGCTISPVILPVEFVNFDAVCSENELDFHWTTYSETNNDYFTIESSIDGDNFSEIGKVEGAGNSSIPTSYQFTLGLLRKDPYYRLKQTDMNGVYTYLQTITVDCKEKESISVYPNPTKKHLFIETNQRNSIIKIYNALGQLIVPDVDFDYSMSVDMSSFNEGLYFVEFTSAIQQQKVIKFSLLK